MSLAPLIPDEKDPLVLQDSRRRFRQLDLIDVVDSEKIESLRQSLDLDVPLTLRWTWDYPEEASELTRLYEKGKLNQWNAETDLDWSTPVTDEQWVIDPRASMLAFAVRFNGGDEKAQRAAAFAELRYLLSQLLHAEQAALQMAGQLTNASHDVDSKMYAASQGMDEARHVEAVSKFINRKLGKVYPVSPVFKVLGDKLMSLDTPARMVVGFQCIFEGVALAQFERLRMGSANPLLKDMITRMAQDEARHTAFGIIAARQAVEEASAEERAELEDFAFCILEALNSNQRLDMLRAVGPDFGIDPWKVTRWTIAAPSWPAANAFSYMRAILPNLKAAGLLTERTLGRYRELEMWNPDARKLRGAELLEVEDV